MLNPAELSAQNPWPGLRAFTESDRDFFFGREREAAELLGIVKRAPVVVLYGQSGLGKTSLLQAGLFPELKRLDFLPLRLRLDHGEDAPPLAQQILRALTSELSRAEVNAPEPGEQETLWEYLHRRDVDFWGPRNRLLTPVLVLDQFEEVFTLGQRSEKTAARVAQFASDLESVIEHRPPAAVRERLDLHPDEALHYDFHRQTVKFVLSIREDFLPQIDPWRTRMPSLLPNRFRLEQMSGAQALAVVELAGRELVEPAVAQAIVDFVSTSQRRRLARSMEQRDVAPALLSVVCDELNRRRLDRAQDRITMDLLTTEQAGIIQGFYLRAFEDIDIRVRDWVEEELLTASGFRDRAAMEDALRLGLSETDFDLLVDRRILHREEREGVVWLELTHDLLTDPAAQSRAAREQRRQLEEAAKRELQRNRELRKSRIAAGVLASLLLVTAVMAVFSEREWKKADENAVSYQLVAQLAKRNEEAADRNAEQAKVNADRAKHMAEHANVMEAAADRSATESKLNATAYKKAAQLAETRLQQQKEALEQVAKGFTGARREWSRIRELLEKQETWEKQPEMLDAYMGMINIIENYSDAIIALNPEDREALSIKAYARWMTAEALRKVNREKEAQEALEQSGSLADKLATGQQPSWRQCIAARTYAFIATETTEESQIKSNQEKARKTAYVAAGRVKGDDFQSWDNLALTYKLIASIDRAEENWDRAIEEYQQQVEMNSRAAAKGDGESAPKIQHDSLEARQRIVSIEVTRKHYDAARQLLGQLLKAAQDPHDLWDVQDSLADLLSQRKNTREEAMKSYRDAIATGRRVLREDAASSDQKKSEAANSEKLDGDYERLEFELSALATVQTLTGQYPKALQTHQKSIALVTEWAAKKPDSRSAEMAQSYQSLADFEETYGDKSASLTDHQKEREWWSKADGSQAGVQREVAGVELKLASLELGFERPDEARKHYTEAAAASQKSIDIVTQPADDGSYERRRSLVFSFESLAWARLGLDDRGGALESLAKSLDAARKAANIAREERVKKDNSGTRDRVISALGTLAWVELLNNHPEAAEKACVAALDIDPSQAWINGNLAHSYLLTNQEDKARTIYVKNQGETVNGDRFEQAVVQDFAALRKLGLGNATMAKLEKDLYPQHVSQP